MKTSKFKPKLILMSATINVTLFCNYLGKDKNGDIINRKIKE